MVELYSSNCETSLNALIEDGNMYYVVENEGETKEYTDYNEAFFNYVKITQAKQGNSVDGVEITQVKQENSVDLLQQAHEWVQKGYAISYFIVNQIENGYAEEVSDGSMPKYTYTFSVHENGEELWYYSVDSLEEGYGMAIKWLKKNC